VAVPAFSLVPVIALQVLKVRYWELRCKPSPVAVVPAAPGLVVKTRL
jgi:hypothetical protein